jgi:hypothetical protein
MSDTTTTQQAAKVLRAILDEYRITGSAMDQRARKAVLVASKALERGKDPEQAIARAYRATGP